MEKEGETEEFLFFIRSLLREDMIRGQTLQRCRVMSLRKGKSKCRNSEEGK